MRIPYLTASLFVILATITSTRADQPPPKLATKKISFKLLREDPDIKADLTRTIELVQLPPGTIHLKGPDGKDHEHNIKPIWIARYETRWDEYNVFWRSLDLTNEQYRAWRDKYPLNTPENKERAWRQYRGMEERPEIPYMPPYGPYDEPYGTAGYPANCIHFQAAVKYCAWLSKQTGHKFRLPTEAEWEYACRAGAKEPFKPDEKSLRDIAWFAGNSKDKPHPVGQKKPNPWGLYDMLGNVGEYVVRDPKDDKGLLAGGSWRDDAKDVHSAARQPYSPDWQGYDPQDPKSVNWFLYDPHFMGFRVVMED